MTNDMRPQATKLYVEKRQNKRANDKSRLQEHVKQPVTIVSPQSRPLGRWAAMSQTVTFFVAGIALHAGFAAALVFSGQVSPKETVRPRATSVVFRQLTKTPPAPPVTQPIAAKQISPPTVEAPPKPIRKKTGRATASKARQPKTVASNEKSISADPVNMNQKPKQTQTRRRIVGISLSSTTTGGKGPSFAVGNTRMGQTDKIAGDKNVKQLGADDVSPGKTAGTAQLPTQAQPSNKAAAFIPTRTRTFEKPQRLSQPTLEYPVSLKNKGIEGNVVVLIVINAEGKVERVRIIRSSGYPEFDRAAEDAALKEFYSPARRDGEPVEYNLKYTYRFRIRGV